MNKNRTVPKIWNLIETKSLSYISDRDDQDFDAIPAQYNTGMYDLRNFNGHEFATVIAMGYDRYAKTQIVFPYQYNKNPEMYFRTSNSKGWRKGLCKVWHDKNLNPDRLETVSKDIIEGINELRNRFENPAILYTNNTGNPVDNFIAAGLTNYRIVNVKYRVAQNNGFSMLNGPDITQTMIYLDGENKYFHLWNGSSRARYEIQGDKVIREYTEGSSAGRICITKIYGIIKK